VNLRDFSAFFFEFFFEVVTKRGIQQAGQWVIKW